MERVDRWSVDSAPDGRRGRDNGDAVIFNLRNEGSSVGLSHSFFNADDGSVKFMDGTLVILESRSFFKVLEL